MPDCGSSADSGAGNEIRRNAFGVRRGEQRRVTPDQVSAAVLAGGFSSRMGRDKALLEINGQTLLEIQVSRLKRLGISDILLSGTGSRIPGARNVGDVYPHRGPLSGIHACMLEAAFPALLVVSVDVPLIPDEALRQLIDEHEGGITVLQHGERTEPLMAVYDCCLAGEAERILKSEKTAVFRLMEASSPRLCPYQGDERLLAGCNTPEEYLRILKDQEN